MYRTDTKITKRKTTNYICPVTGDKQHIEVLAAGQQVVALGDHETTGKPYTWKYGDPVNTPIDKLTLITEKDIDALFAYFYSIVPASWVAKGTNTQDLKPGVQDVNPFSQAPLNITEDDLERALSRISADEYDTWIKVGMALHHQFDGSREGFAIWDEWSSSSDSYQEVATKIHWGSFSTEKHDRPLTAAYILKVGRSREGKPTEGQLGLVSELPETIDDFIERYVYVAGGDLVCDMRRPASYPPYKMSELRNMLAGRRVTLTDKTGREKVVPIHSLWLCSRDRMHAEGYAYRPDKSRMFRDEGGYSWLNSFHLPDSEETTEKGKLGTFFEHMNYILPDPVERAWFISWIAFNVQKPNTRCKVTPLHISLDQGTGRGWIVELMQSLLGFWNCTKTKMDVLSGVGSAGQYQDYLNNSLFCSVEEVKESDKRFSISDRIRDYLTENYLEVNVKFGSKNTQRVFTNFFFMSNHMDALVIPKEDRRIVVLSGPTHHRSEGYYATLYDFLDDPDAVNQLRSWLMRRDLTKFNWTRAIETRGKQLMRDSVLTETERLFNCVLENPPADSMTENQILQAMMAWSDKPAMETHIEEKQFRALLRKNYVHAMRQRITYDGKQCRPWTVNAENNFKDAPSLLTDIQQAASVLAGGRYGVDAFANHEQEEPDALSH
jgi:hypothetical protein